MIELDKNNFAKEVLERKGKILVDFNATWCGPCKMQKPILEEIASDEMVIGALDTDQNEEIAIKYGIMSIPCLILFEDGQEKERLIGLQNKDTILRLFK